MGPDVISVLLCYGLADQLAGNWKNWNDRGRKGFLVSAGFPWCSDHVEWNTRARLVPTHLALCFRGIHAGLAGCW